MKPVESMNDTPICAHCHMAAGVTVPVGYRKGKRRNLHFHCIPTPKLLSEPHGASSHLFKPSPSRSVYQSV